MKIVLSREEVKLILLTWATDNIPLARANSVKNLDRYNSYDSYAEYIELFYTEPVQQELPL